VPVAPKYALRFLGILVALMQSMFSLYSLGRERSEGQSAATKTVSSFQCKLREQRAPVPACT
jgi:hypothetical protein